MNNLKMSNIDYIYEALRDTILALVVFVKKHLYFQFNIIDRNKFSLFVFNHKSGHKRLNVQQNSDV